VTRTVVPFSVGLLLCWGPWVIRNYKVLNAFVPFTTNAGDVFYLANSPGATGGYVELTDRDYWTRVMDEVQLSRMRTARALEWIKSNPYRFLQLGVRKFFLLMEEDHYGFYFTLRWPHPERKALYAGLLMLSNAWWIGVWSVIITSAGRLRLALRSHRDEVLLLLSLLMLTTGVHTVFQSGSRYHIPMLPAVIFLAVTAATRPSEGPLLEDSASR